MSGSFPFETKKRRITRRSRPIKRYNNMFRNAINRTCTRAKGLVEVGRGVAERRRCDEWIFNIPLLTTINEKSAEILSIDS